MAEPTDAKDPQLRVVDRRWWARGEAESAGVDEAPARKPTYVEELEQRVADQAAQIQAFAVERRRSAEEFEQAKGRIRRDVAREVEHGRRAVLVELLDVVDNLERASVAARDAPAEPAALLRGVELVRKQFLAKLEAFGVKRIETLGQPFDASRHEAVSTTPVDDPSRAGLVVGVLREGYTIGDELLRLASVVVGEVSQD